MAISTTNEIQPEIPHPVEPSQLPSSKSEDVKIVVATFSEHMQTSRLNGNEWRGPLTIEQYLKREKHLLAQQLTKEGKEVAWILTSSRLPIDEHGNRAILASCETIPMQAYVARDGNLKEVLVHGIGSVFTRPEHRGKSYASRMMIELGKKLETYQQRNGDQGLFSVLYSDIGQSFYARLGWKAFPSTHIHLSQFDAATYEQLHKDLPEVSDLTTSELQEIPTTEYIKKDLTSASRTNPGRSFAAIAPDMDHFTWHHAREEFVSKALGRSSPTIKGAIHRESGIAVVWTRTYAADKSEWMLHILHVIVPDSIEETQATREVLAALLLRAQLEAHRSEMLAGVEIWDPSPEIVAAAKSLRKDRGDELEVIERDQEHICSLRWSGSSNEDVTWMHRQKYAWC